MVKGQRKCTPHASSPERKSITRSVRTVRQHRKRSPDFPHVPRPRSRMDLAPERTNATDKQTSVCRSAAAGGKGNLLTADWGGGRDVTKMKGACRLKIRHARYAKAPSRNQCGAREAEMRPNYVFIPRGFRETLSCLFESLDS